MLQQPKRDIYQSTIPSIVTDTMTKTTNVTSCFLIATLTPVVGEDAHVPLYTTLHILQIEINSNTMSVPTRVVNGDLGYLALVISEAEFLTHSGGIAYIAPTSPLKLLCTQRGQRQPRSQKSIASISKIRRCLIPTVK